jgi:hypothetical protein
MIRWNFDRPAEPAPDRSELSRIDPDLSGLEPDDLLSDPGGTVTDLENRCLSKLL